MRFRQLLKAGLIAEPFMNQVWILKSCVWIHVAMLYSSQCLCMVIGHGFNLSRSVTLKYNKVSNVSNQQRTGKERLVPVFTNTEANQEKIRRLRVNMR